MASIAQSLSAMMNACGIRSVHSVTDYDFFINSQSLIHSFIHSFIYLFIQTVYKMYRT